MSCSTYILRKFFNYLTCLSMAKFYVVSNLFFVLLCTEVPRCENPVDVAFLMDASGSIGEANYKLEKNFVKEVVYAFGVSEAGSHAGIITYSDDAELNINFEKYKSLDSFNQAVDSLPYSKGRTRIDKALDLASNQLFTVQEGMRPNVPKIAIVMTDGKQTAASDAVALEKAVAPLHALGVQVFAIGIGTEVDQNELALMVKRPEDVRMSTFEGLQAVVADISLSTCKTTSKLTVVVYRFAMCFCRYMFRYMLKR